jgi:hypothetical protein
MVNTVTTSYTTRGNVGIIKRPGRSEDWMDVNKSERNDIGLIFFAVKLH